MYITTWLSWICIHNYIYGTHELVIILQFNMHINHVLAIHTGTLFRYLNHVAVYVVAHSSIGMWLHANI